MNLKVTCRLGAPLASDLPMLDAVIEGEMAHLQGKGQSIQRDRPAPPYGEIGVPYRRAHIGGMSIPCCSSPIAVSETETVEHFGKRLATEHADLLAESKRQMVPVGNGYLKSYRLPLRLRHCREIVWFIDGNQKEIRRVLQKIVSLGKKRSFGYGIVNEWVVDEIEQDLSWFAKTDRGTILMRPLPKCSELPADLIGFREEFGAAQSPYWHPDRYCERVVPC